MTHVLVTRPLEASQALACQLDALGLTPVVMPLYTFTAREPGTQTKSAWSAGTGRKLAVFTSPRAVHFGLPHLPVNLDNLELAAVGPATRAALEKSGLEVDLQAPAGFTSEDLLQLPGLTHELGQAVIFCAPGGRQTLAEGLAGMGWCVTRAMVYERLPLRPSPSQVEQLQGADELLSVWTSTSAIKLAAEYLPAAVWAIILKAPALVISTRIRQHLQQLGARRVELSEGPGNDELLRSIRRITGR